jgi:hypothetical protein
MSIDLTQKISVILAGLDTRLANAEAAVPRTLRIAFAGSSTYEKYGTDGSGTTVSNATRSTDGVTFAAMGTQGTGLLSYAGIIANRAGVSVQYLMRGRGGTTVANDWLPAGSGDRANLVNAIKAMGGVDLLNWACGFNDAFQNILVSEAQHLANLRQLFALIRSETGLPNLKIGVGVSQLYTGTETVAPDAKWTALRSAEMTVAQDANNHFSAQWYDLPQGDGIHMTGASLPIHAARIAENGLAALGLGGAVSETGPRVTAATAIYNTKTRVTITHSRGTEFTPTAGLSGFLVSFDNGETLVSPTAAVRVDATNIDLTHSASGGAAPTVYDFIGRAPSTTAIIKDNSPRTLPLNPSYSAGVKAASGSVTADPATSTPTPTPTPTPTARTAKVAFSRSNPAPAGFNAFGDSQSVAQNSNAGRTKALLDTAGAASGWTLTTTNFNAGNDTQGTTTGANTGPSPDAAMLGYWYNGNTANGDNGGVATPSTTLSLSGLDAAKRYTFKVFAARAASDRKVTFTAGDKNGATSSQTIDAGQNGAPSNPNPAAIATFSTLAPDANGLLTLTFAPAPTYGFGYINVLEITETTP